jgi:hypothetical protein
MRALALLISASSALVFSACSAQSTVADHQPKSSQAAGGAHTHGMKTVKPGAALTFTHEFDGEFQVGAYSDVIISFDDQYRSGQVKLIASGSDSLDVLSSTARKTMSVGSGEDWRVAVKPHHDGVHYLNIIGQVDSNGLSAVRTHAIRIDLGGKTQDPVTAGKAELRTIGQEQLAVFEAQEEIIQSED